MPKSLYSRQTYVNRMVNAVARAVVSRRLRHESTERLLAERPPMQQSGVRRYGCTNTGFSQRTKRVFVHVKTYSYYGQTIYMLDRILGQETRRDETRHLSLALDRVPQALCPLGKHSLALVRPPRVLSPRPWPRPCASHPRASSRRRRPGTRRAQWLALGSAASRTRRRRRARRALCCSCLRC